MIQIYKPNKSNTGCAMNVQIGRAGKKRELAVFLQSILQFSWDDQKKTGSFSGNREDKDKNITFKLTESECGGVISAIKNRHEFSAFHSHEQNKTSLKLIPWDKEFKGKGKNGEYTYTQPAFGLTIVRNGNQTFRVPLECGEARCIVALLENYLDKLYEERFEAREADMRNRNNNQGGQSTQSDSGGSQTESNSEPASEEEVPF